MKKTQPFIIVTLLLFLAAQPAVATAWPPPGTAIDFTGYVLALHHETGAITGVPGVQVYLYAEGPDQDEGWTTRSDQSGRFEFDVVWQDDQTEYRLGIDVDETFTPIAAWAPPPGKANGAEEINYTEGIPPYEDDIVPYNIFLGQSENSGKPEPDEAMDCCPDPYRFDGYVLRLADGALTGVPGRNLRLRAAYVMHNEDWQENHDVTTDINGHFRSPEVPCCEPPACDGEFRLVYNDEQAPLAAWGPPPAINEPSGILYRDIREMMTTRSGLVIHNIFIEVPTGTDPISLPVCPPPVLLRKWVAKDDPLPQGQLEEPTQCNKPSSPWSW